MSSQNGISVALVAFAVLVVVAGGNAVAIRETSCEDCELEPFWGASSRFLLAALLFAAIVVSPRIPLPRGRALQGAVLFGVLQFGAGFGMIYWGLVNAPAGLGQVLLASVPLLTFFLALAHRQEPFRARGLMGALLATGGIAVIFWIGTADGVPLVSMLAILAGAVCWAEALVVVRGFPQVHPAAMNAAGMGVGGVILFVASLLHGESHDLPQTARTWWAMGYLVVGGSVGVFSLYVLVLRELTASRASYQLVLIPLVTVALSAWLQDEQITWRFAAGAMLVLLGVYYGAIAVGQTEPVPEPRPTGELPPPRR